MKRTEKRYILLEYILSIYKWIIKKKLKFYIMIVMVDGH